MQASIRVLALLMITVLALAGCTSDSDDESDESENETPVATETSEPEETEDPNTEEEQETTATPEDEAEPAETPDADEVSSERRIEPHELMLVAENGEQSGQFGPYFWTNEDLELAAEVQGGYYERQEEPLEVSQGEEVAIETPEDDFPTEITLEVFPPTEPNENGLVEMEPESESTEDLDPENAVWTVNLEPGEHYVELETVWPTNEVWGRDREVTYRYWISVTE